MKATTENRTIIVPLVHMNGDRKESLQGPIADAAYAIREALKALHATCPNARNYYVISDQAFSKAMDQYITQLERLQVTYDELAAMFNAIGDNKTEVSL